MNLNELAKQICLLEGGKKQLTVAQVKEVLKCLGEVLNSLETADAFALLAKLKKQKPVQA